MFKNLFSKKSAEERAIEKSEKRQMDFAREQTMMNAGTHPEDDKVYLETQEKRSDLIRWQQEMEEDMFKLILNFRGLKIDEHGEITRILDEKGKPIPPLCNWRFIHQVVEPKLRPFLSKNLINSRLDTYNILEMQRTTADDIVDMMADNWDVYGIDFVNFDGILRDIKNVMKASAWRAYQGWTKKVDSSMIKRLEHEMYGEAEANKKRKFGIFG